MTIQDFINLLSNNSQVIINYYLVLLVISLCGLLSVHENNFKSPVTYLYTILVYAIATPGMLSFILVVYNLFFLKQNLINLPIVVYYLPLIAMIVLLLVIHKTITLKKIPGFDRLLGLFTTILITLFLTYFIQRIFIGVFFIGGLTHLFVIFIVLLVLLKIGWSKLVK
ncbi:hypothetical protein DFQ07_0871 [Tenacibaculum caenipelagi]|uniref:Uncharacterized protein n=1 Tax=Tenacibaculum caenipelagi TaxID=1325435 RepID=A0A4R6TEY4_9FLAO|nr:hypothetical protein DFQ07_0871 [Tenacibaculum caenipelagi]